MRVFHTRDASVGMFVAIAISLWTGLSASATYTQMSFIKCNFTGTGQTTAYTWVNTGYTPECTDRIEMKLRLDTRDSSQTLFCSRKDGTQQTMTAFFIWGSSKLTMRADRNTTQTAISRAFTSDASDHIFVYDGNALSFSCDGTKLATLAGGSFTCGSPLTLFASHAAGTGLSASTTMGNYAKYRFYYCRIYNKNGKLIHNYVPARDDSAAVGAKKYGVYDTIAERFLQNSGTTSFVVTGASEGGQLAPATLSGVEVRQRYPWNGLVDMDFTLNGSGTANSTLLLSVADVAGATNVALRTFTVDGKTADPSAPFIGVKPGAHRIVWNAWSDCPHGVASGLSATLTVGSSTKIVAFPLDLRGLGPWERRTAKASETIVYSPNWETNLSGARAVVKVMPALKAKPRYVVLDLSGGSSATHVGVTYLDDMPSGGWTDEYKTSKLVLRHIPAGSFIMGGRNTDYPGAVNTNLHMVTITRDFYMGVFEVTQRQWELVMGNNPSSFTNRTCYAMRPAEMMSWCDIRGSVRGIEWPRSKFVDDDSFLGRLRAKTEINGLDLPTEAQWEYACRAGTTTAFNSGKNGSGAETCPEADEVARYAGNADLSFTEHTVRYSYDTNRGTAIVGSYQSNAWGIWDMHGNVWERCLDMDDPGFTGSVDPVGAINTNTVCRQIRGGCWTGSTSSLVSGDHHKYYDTASDRWMGNRETGHYNSVGLRLCLQGGDLPDFSMAVTVANSTVGGTCAWVPKEAGSYYVAHETIESGECRQLLSCWVEVPGPKLEIVPQGELTNGVAVSVEGAGDWPVYYTTDGTVPTSASTLYEGPFVLPESATVKAVAISAGGIASEAATATLTLHDALGVVGAVARQRYPWNGKVDIDCEVKGDATKKYAVTFAVEDEIEHTNLPIRTVGRAGSMNPPDGDGNGGFIETALPFVLSPGRYRFTWDAAADIEGDYDFARVAVTVKATGSHLLAYPKTLELTVAGYTGTEVLTNVPTLVRLSTNITGFAYSDFATTNGADLAFFDAAEHPLPYEIDEWNTNGESLVWVKLPTLANGTRFTCAYGNKNYSLFTMTSSLGPHAVWRDYAGVWHMNEDSGTAFDSTEHHLDGIPSCGTNKLANVNQMVAYENGACGRARVNATTKAVSGNCLLVPSYDALALGGTFSVQGWFFASVNDQFYPKIFFRDWGHGSVEYGWGVEFGNGILSGLSIVGGSNLEYMKRVPASSCVGCWTQFVFVYDGATVCCYQDGRLLAEGGIIPAADNGQPLGIGANPQLDTDATSFVGQYDEIRLRGGSLSADRIKADYDMIANREFLSYGAVRNGQEVVHE